MGTQVYIVNDVDLLRKPLRDEGAEFLIPFNSFVALLGSGSQMTDPHKHTAWRKLMMLATGSGALERMFPDILRLVQGHVHSWAEVGSFDMFGAATELSLDLATHVLIGIRFTQTDPQWIRNEFKCFMRGLYVLPIQLPGTAYSRALQARKNLAQRLWGELGVEVKRVTEKVQTSKAAGIEPSAMHQGCSQLGMLEAQITAQLDWTEGGQGITKDDATGYLLGNLVGSADTTRGGMFHTMALLAMSDRVRGEVVKEQLQLVTAHGPDLTFQQLHEMPYLDAVVREVMRLLPASSGSFRRLLEDTQMGAYTLPKGSIIWWHAGLLHATDPVLWDGNTRGGLPLHMDWEAHLEQAFLPERWLSKEGRPRHYYTFGSGRHLCLGMQLYNMEVKMLVAEMARRGDWHLLDEKMMSKADKYPLTKAKPGTDATVFTVRPATL
ncbi:MAG: hypothetical protein WDW38_005718 [Sanguina aurantia]